MASSTAQQQDDLQPNLVCLLFQRQYLFANSFLTKVCPGEDDADYKETLILGKEVTAKMVELGTRRLANSLA